MCRKTVGAESSANELSNELSNELDEISVFEIARSRLFHFEQFWGKNVDGACTTIRLLKKSNESPIESMLALRENSPKKQYIKIHIHKNHIYKEPIFIRTNSHETNSH